MKKCWRTVIFLLVFLTLLTGCASSSEAPIERRWASIQGGQVESAQAGEEFFFTIPVDDRKVSQIPVRIQISGEVFSGSLRFELRGPDGQTVWDSGTIRNGDFAITHEVLPERTGEYLLGLVYTDGTSARYDLNWHALRLTPAVFLPGAGMALVALAFVFYLALRRLGGGYLALGAFFWVVTVALKFGFAIFANPAVFRTLGVSNTGLFTPGNLTAYLYIGALTGIFEVGLTYLILLKTRFGRARWDQALAFGIGFGAVEALLLGISSLVSAGTGFFAPQLTPALTMSSLAQANSLWVGLAPIVERLGVILAHIFASVLIFYAIARREAKWAWLSILYKTILDAPAGFAAFWGTETLAKLWTIEAAVIVMGLVGLWGAIQIGKRYPGMEARPDSAVMAIEEA